MTPRKPGCIDLALCTLLGAGLAACESPSAPPVPAALVAVTGEIASGTAGAALPVQPAVRVEDARGRPMAGVPVVFSVAEGDGRIDAGETATDRSGTASPGTWTLGARAGINVLVASVQGLPAVRFTATASAGAPALLRVHAGGTQTATAGSHVAILPTVQVLDAHDNPVPGTPVTFSVAAGDGVLAGIGANAASGATSLTLATDDAGLAAPSAWQMGTTAGPNLLEARAPGIPTIVAFNAVATPGPAAALTAHVGDNQAAPAGSRVPIAPAVRVTDAFGNAVAGVPVTFEITSGGGAAIGASQATGADGIAAADGWDLGPVPGPNTIAARAGSLAPLTFTANGTQTAGGTGGSGSGSQGGFTLEMRYTTTLSGSQLAAFSTAAGRWNAAITGDLPDAFVTIGVNGCGAPHPAVSENIDDLVVFVTVKSIDGPGKILGSAGPCRIRSGSNLPAVGILYLDRDDLAGLDANGLLDDVIMHEMGHVLGIGTLWPSGLIADAGGSDPIFTGAGAVAQFLGAGGSAYAGTPVPVENTGGAGTRDAHWRESVMASEIMTGWINFGGNPLSRVTIVSLADMGYQVDASAADAFQISGVSSLGQDAPLPGFEVVEGTLPPPIVIDASAGAAATRTAAASPAASRRIPAPKKAGR